jgi:hypothetical protein
MQLNNANDDSLDDIKWLIIRRYYKLTGHLIDPSRVTILNSFNEISLLLTFNYIFKLI